MAAAPALHLPAPGRRDSHDLARAPSSAFRAPREQEVAVCLLHPSVRLL